MSSVSAVSARWADLRGRQTPRIETVPPYVYSEGAGAVELSAMAGLMLDEWQCRVLDGALGLDADGHWTAPEVGSVVGRQNGKGSIVETVTLNGLYWRRSKMVYTSHLMATSRKLRERIQYLIESVPDFDKEVKQIRVANEEQSIALKPPPTIISGSGKIIRPEAARIDFVARTGASARGWAAYDVIFFDEAFALAAAMVGAMMPILFARSDWQIWYVSMAGMANSDALRQVRNRGIAKDPELAYYEWSVDDAYHEAPEFVANMPTAWAQANPALGGRITVKTLARAQRSMDPAEFGREVLCAWDDPSGAALITPGQWSRLTDPLSEITSGMVMVLECSPGMVSGAIGVAGMRADGIPHLEITSRDGRLDYRAGTGWMIPRVVELNEAHRPVAWVIDASGPARALLPELQAVGIEPYLMMGREVVAACGSMLQAATAPEGDRLRHLGQPEVAEAIKATRKRDVGDAWVFSRRASELDIIPFMVLTLALYGLAMHEVALYDIVESVR